MTKEIIKEFKVEAKTSTVCGYPGKDFDWSKADFEGKTSHVDRCHYKGCKHQHTYKAPEAHVDDFLIEEGSQYLHVAWNYEEDCTIFRVRPRWSVGDKYRGKLIKQIKAIKKDGQWYWQMILTSVR